MRSFFLPFAWSHVWIALAHLFSLCATHLCGCYAFPNDGRLRRALETVGTLVYPVKATYTVKTHYRQATEVEANWIRILNFYVNSFGEWQIGSEETV